MEHNFFGQELRDYIGKHYEDHHNLNRRFSNFSAQFKQYFALLHRWIVRIHRPARESSDLRNVNRKRDRCIFYSTWVKRVCCVSKLSSDCGCQSKEIGVGMEVRLLSVDTRGFFLAVSRLAIAAQFCRPQREKNLWKQGTRPSYRWYLERKHFSRPPHSLLLDFGLFAYI